MEKIHLLIGMAVIVEAVILVASRFLKSRCESVADVSEDERRAAEEEIGGTSPKPADRFAVVGDVVENGKGKPLRISRIGVDGYCVHEQISTGEFFRFDYSRSYDGQPVYWPDTKERVKFKQQTKGGQGG